MRKFPISHFAVALDAHMAKRGYNAETLLRKLTSSAQFIDSRNLHDWRIGRRCPRRRMSFHILERIEHLFGLPAEYFSNALCYQKSSAFRAVRTVAASQRMAMRWHIPDDFDDRPQDEQAKILKWIGDNVLPGTTDFGKYQRRNHGLAFAIVFPGLRDIISGRIARGHCIDSDAAVGKIGAFGTIAAPVRLEQEVRDLIIFKTSLLAPRGAIRGRRWERSTAGFIARRLGEMLGALAAAPSSSIGGLGVPIEKLTLGIFAFPAVWDWYFQLKKKRRGFFSHAETSLAYQGKEMSQDPTGWLRQRPALAKRVPVIEGIIRNKDIQQAKRNWTGTCESMNRFARVRILDLREAAQQHRDPFVPILPILNSPSPLREYRKIADEIVRHLPDPKAQPLGYAIKVRAYLMFRLAMHTGFRQRNLRELLFTVPGERVRSIQELRERKRGEMRWDTERAAWEIFIPACAFKNKTSSFFNGRPFQLWLSDLQGLYRYIDHYIKIDRAILIDGKKDPGTFLVRNTRRWGISAEYDMFCFYAAWKRVIQLYGIHNPYTGRGVIKGLLPHGPHVVRDVLATHILKTTNSVDLAAFAIQDTAHAVQRHYGRFIPQEKTALAAKELDAVWL